jgi:hypothetical protein
MSARFMAVCVSQLCIAVFFVVGLYTVTAHTTHAASLSSLEQQIEKLLAQLQQQQQVPQVAVLKKQPSKVTVQYTNITQGFYIALLWKDSAGQWVEVGQAPISNTKKKGTTQIKLTGINPETESSPTGLFKVRVITHSGGSGPVDSSIFVLSESMLKPTCTLEANNYYPGNSDIPVELRWTSMNADYVKVKKVLSVSEKSQTMSKRFAKNGKKTFYNNETVKYVYTFYGKGGQATCDVTINYKG